MKGEAKRDRSLDQFFENDFLRSAFVEFGEKLLKNVAKSIIRSQ